MVSDADRAEIARMFGPVIAASEEFPTKEEIADSMLFMMNDLTPAERAEMKAEFVERFSLAGLMALEISMRMVKDRHDRR